MIKKELRCIHRHTIQEHPNCFLKGLINYDFSNDKEFEKLTGLPWYTFPGYKIGYFDIETDNLNADFGTVLSWSIKVKGEQNVLLNFITKEELFNGTLDKNLVKSFVDTVKDFNILIGYNSDWFDMPYMRAKALHYGFDFPGYGELYHWDLYWLVKSKLRLSRRSLENVCDYLGIVGKTHLDKDIWRKAKYGDAESIRYIIEHNRQDVLILEELHNKLEPAKKWTRRSV